MFVRQNKQELETIRVFEFSFYTVDEQIVLYNGKNSSKQTIRTKTIRFECKDFVICSDNGSPYFIDPYCEVKYGGGKPSRNLTACSIIDCVMEIDNWGEKEVLFNN